MCGVIGIINNSNVAQTVRKGLCALQHRGQTSCGVLTYDGEWNYQKGVVARGKNDYSGLVRDVLTDISDLDGNVAIGHVRYGTSGGNTRKSLIKNAQPRYTTEPGVGGCHNGQLLNCHELITQSNRKLRTDLDFELFLNVFADELGKYKNVEPRTIFDAAKKIMSVARGSYFVSMIVTDEQKRSYLVGINDPAAIRPAVLGKTGNSYALASETVALERMGYEYVRDLIGGEVCIIGPVSSDKETKDEINIKSQPIRAAKPRHCLFELIYFAHPGSKVWGINVYDSRFHAGEFIGRKYPPPKDTDVVVAVPDSGREYASGFSSVTGIPLREGLIRDKYVGRVFIGQTKSSRDIVAEEKFYPVESVLKDKNVVLVDDSKVRGTNLRRVVDVVKKAGAKNVDVRTGVRIKKPCYLGIDMTKKKQFVSMDGNRTRSFEEIAAILGARTYACLEVEEVVQVLGTNELCTGCIGGDYPEELEEEIKSLHKQKSVNGRRPTDIAIAN